MRFWYAFVVAILLTPVMALANKHCDKYPLQNIENTDAAGWKDKELQLIKQMLVDIGSAAFMVLKDGKVVLNYGDNTKDYNVHSIRKSFLTGLIGIAVKNGDINLDQTVEQMDIDDKQPLSKVEKTATFRQLIQARSGIYHPAAYETKTMAAQRPKRHRYKPGEFWYYNNWDFNVAGRWYEMRTGKNIHIAFGEKIARPLCMQDYDLSLMSYHYESQTLYPAYPFRMSTRDMALYGQLYLQKGKWNNQQVLPKGWVSESTTIYSKTNRAGSASGYGYMWWVTRKDTKAKTHTRLPLNSYTANGAGGHRITVLPSMNMVVVNRMNTDLENGPRLTGEQYDKLLRLIITARK